MRLVNHTEVLPMSRQERPLSSRELLNRIGLNEETPNSLLQEQPGASSAGPRQQPERFTREA